MLRALPIDDFRVSYSIEGSLHPVFNPHLAQDGGNVMLDRTQGPVETLGDFTIADTIDNHPQNVDFATGQAKRMIARGSIGTAFPGLV